MMAHDQLVAPATLEEAGLSLDLVGQLVLKTLYFSGELTGTDIAKRLGVTFSVVEPALEFQKVHRRCEIVGGDILGGASYRYRITTDGRTLAALYLQQNQYAGVAPVPIAQYRKYMMGRRQTGATALSRDQVQRGFSHLVLGPTVLDEIGPAISSGHSVFIYGPPGNGKTVIAHALWELLAGDILIPHAIELEGSIIRVFDPVTHDPRIPAEDGDITFDPALKQDARWVPCRRPLVKAGGELSLDSLNLTLDSRLGYYRAPLQLMANGGMLLLDDFGRQRSAPRELLNRWTVPLESGFDYLALQSGVTFEVPFHVFVAFATNLKPSELADEAFLRRVRHKVFADGPTIEEFVAIFEGCCRDKNVPFDRAVVDGLLNGYFMTHGVTRRACHPRDLINQALLLAAYRGDPRVLTTELLEKACSAYFMEESW